MRKANALAILRRNAGCSEPALIAVTIKTKISFTGSSFSFLSVINIECGYSLELPEHWGGSYEYKGH